MEIKELVDYTQRIKLLRNELEFISIDLMERHEQDKDNQDRMGLPFDIKDSKLDDVASKLDYGLADINTAVALLEMVYRNSVRLRKQEEKDNTPKENQGESK